MSDFKQFLIEALDSKSNKSVVDIYKLDGDRLDKALSMNDVELYKFLDDRHMTYLNHFKDSIKGEAVNIFDDITKPFRVYGSPFGDAFLRAQDHQYYLLCKKVLCHIKRIMPSRYFKMAADTRHDSSAQIERDNLYGPNVEKYTKAMRALVKNKTGDRFPIVTLDYATKTDKYDGSQEGRHRSAAAELVSGVTFIPCFISNKIEEDEIAGILGFAPGWTYKHGTFNGLIKSPDGKIVKKTSSQYVTSVVRDYWDAVRQHEKRDE